MEQPAIPIVEQPAAIPAMEQSATSAVGHQNNEDTGDNSRGDCFVHWGHCNFHCGAENCGACNIGLSSRAWVMLYFILAAIIVVAITAVAITVTHFLTRHGTSPPTYALTFYVVIHTSTLAKTVS
jgi:hypothetical protein